MGGGGGWNGEWWMIRAFPAGPLYFPSDLTAIIPRQCDMWEASAEEKVPAHNQWCHDVMCCSRKYAYFSNRRFYGFDPLLWKLPTGFQNYPVHHNLQWPYLVEYEYFLEFLHCEYSYSLLYFIHQYVTYLWIHSCWIMGTCMQHDDWILGNFLSKQILIIEFNKITSLEK